MSSPVTVLTADDALSNLRLSDFQAVTIRHHLSNCELLDTIYVVELKHNWVSFSAVNARMGG